MITTKSGFKNALQESERDAFGNYTWRQAMSNIDYQTKLAEAQAKQLYGEDVATAYQAATQQRAAIAGTAFGQGTKELLMSDTERALSQAYDQYMSNYAQNIANIQNQASTAYSELNKALEERSKYMSDYEQEHYKYLQSLDTWFQKQIENATDDVSREKAQQAYDDFVKGDLSDWKKFYNVTDQGATLKTWDELTTPVQDPLTGEYISLYDAEGRLTRAGQDFYDQMENYYSSRMAKEGETLPPSFQQYLYSENQELYDWANQYNPYSYAPNLAGESTNVGAFKQLLGIESTDEQYSFLERFGGLSRLDIENTFDTLFDTLSSKDINVDSISDVVSELRNVSEKLGFSSVDWQQVQQQTETALNEYYKYSADAKSSRTEALAGYSAAGVAMAIAIGSVIASVASIPTGIGIPAAAASGNNALLAAGTSIAAYKAGKESEANAIAYENLANLTEGQLKQMYLDALTMMSSEVQSKYQQQAIGQGGVLGSKLGKGIDTLEKLGGKSNKDNFDSNYDKFLAYNKNKSSNTGDYNVRHLDYGSGYNKLLVTIDGSKYSLSADKSVTNTNEVAALNKYATGNKDTLPNVDKIVVLANKMYIYTKRGWKTVTNSDISRDNASNKVEDAVKTFLK